jgi:hypothetical protein
MEAAAFRLYLSGTLERADGRRILGLPYQPAAPGVAGDPAALEPARLAVDRPEGHRQHGPLGEGLGARIAPRVGPHRLGAGSVRVTTRPALFTALRTGFARDLPSIAPKVTGSTARSARAWARE